MSDIFCFDDNMSFICMLDFKNEDVDIFCLGRFLNFNNPISCGYE